MSALAGTPVYFGRNGVGRRKNARDYSAGVSAGLIKRTK